MSKLLFDEMVNGAPQKGLCPVYQDPIMRLTIRSNLAMRTLMFCAVNPGRVVRKHEIAAACNASENHLAQVVNNLSQLGFINTQRGRAGGMTLAHAPQDIRVGAVLRAFEGGLPVAECFDPEANSCPLASACIFRDALSAAIEAFYASMDQWTLADMVGNNSALHHLLEVPQEDIHPACVSRKPLPEQMAVA